MNHYFELYLFVPIVMNQFLQSRGLNVSVASQTFSTEEWENQNRTLFNEGRTKVVYDRNQHYTMTIEKSFISTNTNSAFPSQNIELTSLRNVSRGAVLVQLPFPFRFYTSYLSKLLVTTEGFLSMSTRLHDKMQLMQYVAPLKANFVPHSEDGKIIVSESSNHITFKWNNVILEALPKL